MNTRLASTLSCRAIAVGVLLLVDLLGALIGRDAAAVWVFDSTAPFVARAPLAFELRVEKFVFLQIGSPGAVVDEVSFDLGGTAPASQTPGLLPGPLPGSGEAVRATSGGQQLVIVRGNQGSITLSVAGLDPRGLSNSTGAFIRYDQILISSDNPALPAPTIGASGVGSSAIVANGHAGLVTDQSANWEFRLANTLAAPGGTYRGQLGFTISMP